MPAEHTDAALLTLSRQWRRKHPRAVVWYRGDEHHRPPSDHLPDAARSIDAGDYMPGRGVEMPDLVDLADQLVASRDPRISYLIIGTRIVSSRKIGNTPAWVWRKYTGTPHGHLHVSVNDTRPNDTTEWRVTLMTPDEREQLIADVAKAVHERPIDRPDALGGRARLKTILAYLGSRETIAQRVAELLNPRLNAVESRLAELERPCNCGGSS